LGQIDRMSLINHIKSIMLMNACFKKCLHFKWNSCQLNCQLNDQLNCGLNCQFNLLSLHRNKWVRVQLSRL